MTMLDYSTLAVGDQVAVMTEYGTAVTGYTVIKADKVKVVVERNNYTRTFSVKKRCEMGSTSRWKSATLISVSDAEQIENERNLRRLRNECWTKLQEAAISRSLEQLKTALAELESI